MERLHISACLQFFVCTNLHNLDSKNLYHQSFTARLPCVEQCKFEKGEVNAGNASGIWDGVFGIFVAVIIKQLLAMHFSTMQICRG